MVRYRAPEPGRQVRLLRVWHYCTLLRSARYRLTGSDACPVVLMRFAGDGAFLRWRGCLFWGVILVRTPVASLSGVPAAAWSLRLRWATVLVAVASLLMSGAVAVAPAASASVVPKSIAPPLSTTTSAGGGEFVPVTPVRIVDSRIGLGGPKAQLVAGSALNYTVLGAGGVPSSGVSAVVVTVAAVAPTANGYLTVWPAGEGKPATSQANYNATSTVDSTVVAKVGQGGQLSVQPSAGNLDLVMDVQGYYTDNTVTTAGGTFVPLSPARLVNTAAGVGSPVSPLPANGSRAFTLTGAGGVPASGVQSVVVAMQTFNVTASGYESSGRTGDPRPGGVDVNLNIGHNTSNLVVIAVDGNGSGTVYNSSVGTTDLILDVEGYNLTSSSAQQQVFVPMSPVRIYNTTTGQGTGSYATTKVTGGSTRDVTLWGAKDPAGNTIIPTTGVSAVVLSVQVQNPGATGYLTGYPGSTRPGVSFLTYNATASGNFSSELIAATPPTATSPHGVKVTRQIWV